MRIGMRSMVVVALICAGAVVGCGKKDSSGGAPTPAQLEANCMFLCADLLEGCPQPARATSQTSCVNACKADTGNKVKTCSTKVASATGAKRCSAVDSCMAGK